MADENPWEIPEGAFLTVCYGRSVLSDGYYDTLPDGTSACGYDGNIVTMVLAPQMVSQAGAVLNQVEILHDQQMLATFAFRLMVEVNPAFGIMQPENYVNWIQWMQNQLERSVEYMIENGGFTGPAGLTGSAGTNGASAVLLSAVVDYQAEVSFVANIFPDDNGNVLLTAEHVGALAYTGGALSGELKMNGQVIGGLNFPVADNQAANKGYVDSVKT